MKKPPRFLRVILRSLLAPSFLRRKLKLITEYIFPHKVIYRVLLSHGLIEINMRKRQQRKWVRYERKYSMSLWQGDWKEFEIDGTKK
jgi:putative transposase